MNVEPTLGATSGEIVTFGHYPQRVDGEERSPIQWRVLHNSGTELLLLSEYLLDCKRYHGDSVDVTWRDCDLRKWLNGGFYTTAFDDAERELIKTTRCTDNGEGMPDTEDKVFLLSAAQVRALTRKDGSGVERRAIGTEFASLQKTDGCRLYVYDKSIETDYLTANGRQQGCSWWWLRTQLGESSRSTFVGMRGTVRSYGRVNLKYYGVRPALTLEVDT